MKKPFVYALGVFPMLAIGSALCVAIILVDGAMRRANNTSADEQIATRIANAVDGTWRKAELRASDGAVLRGWHFQPPFAPVGAVIALHGVGDTRQGTSGHAGYLLEAGYSVLLPDSRAHGESGGNRITYGVMESQDVASWAVWLRKQHPGPIYGIGISMGAAVVLQALPHARLSAVVAESAFSCFDDIGEHRLAQATSLPRILTRPTVALGLQYAEWFRGVALQRACPEHALQQDAHNTPVLLIHGTSDKNIPVEHSRHMSSLLEPPVELWEVTGAGHVEVFARVSEEYRHRVLMHFATHGETAQ